MKSPESENILAKLLANAFLRRLAAEQSGANVIHAPMKESQCLSGHCKSQDINDQRQGRCYGSARISDGW